MYTPTTPQAKDPLQVGEVKVAYWLMGAAGALTPSGATTRVTEEGDTRVTEEGDTRVTE